MSLLSNIERMEIGSIENTREAFSCLVNNVCVSYMYSNTKTFFPHTPPVFDAKHEVVSQLHYTYFSVKEINRDSVLVDFSARASRVCSLTRFIRECEVCF